jgi:hypothetical protein
MLLGGRRAEEHGHRAPRLRGHLQAAKPRIVLTACLPGGFHPQHDRAARAGLERLLRGPERVFPIGGTNDEAAIERNTHLRNRRRVRKVRRIYPGDQPAVRACTRERPRKESDFADAHHVVQHFRERALRPAAAGQLRIEERMTRRHHGMHDVFEFPSTPDAGKLHQLGNRGFHLGLR